MKENFMHYAKDTKEYFPRCEYEGFRGSGGGSDRGAGGGGAFRGPGGGGSDRGAGGRGAFRGPAGAGAFRGPGGAGAGARGRVSFRGPESGGGGGSLRTGDIGGEHTGEGGYGAGGYPLGAHGYGNRFRHNYPRGYNYPIGYNYPAFPSLCTEINKDAFATGVQIECCPGLTQCLADWNNDNNPSYLCKKSCDE